MAFRAGERPAINLRDDLKVYQELIEACWAQEAKKRPSFAELCAALDAEDFALFPRLFNLEPDLCPPSHVSPDYAPNCPLPRCRHAADSLPRPLHPRPLPPLTQQHSRGA